MQLYRKIPITFFILRAGSEDTLLWAQGCVTRHKKLDIQKRHGRGSLSIEPYIKQHLDLSHGLLGQTSQPETLSPRTDPESLGDLWV